MIKRNFKNRILTVVLGISVFFITRNQIFAKPLPLWEVGAGLFSFWLNDYRGSDQGEAYYWPLPYFIYRGKVIEAENSMIKGNVYDSGRFSLGMSLSASLRVSGSRNRTRYGMPSLDPTFEVGPVPSYNFWTDSDKKNFFAFYWPIRKVFSIDFWNIESIGYFTVPYFAFISNPQPATLGLFSVFTAAAMFATRKYHSYFYEVPSQYVRPGRNAYQAKGGYSGWHTTWFGSKKFEQFYLFAFVRYDNLKNTVFEDSPLVKSSSYWAFGGGFIWYFLQSDTRVERKFQK